MKRFNKLGLAAALLAGSALSVTTVSAQEAADPTKPRLQQDQKAPSARSEAPGQKKLDGQAATEVAPGQKQKTGQADAQDAAPGQVKTEGQAEATGDTMKKTDGQADAAATAGEKKPDDKAATEFAPGQKQKTGQADAQDAAPGQQQKMGEADANDAAPGQIKQDQAADEQQPSDETTASIDISAEQKTEIRTIIREAKVEPADIDIDLRVGVEVPRTVELHPLPPRFVEIVPEYRDYVFFVLADGRVVIVRPNTYEVVYILVV